MSINLWTVTRTTPPQPGSKQTVTKWVDQILLMAFGSSHTSPHGVISTYPSGDWSCIYPRICHASIPGSCIYLSADVSVQLPVHLPVYQSVFDVKSGGKSHGTC